MCHSHLKDTTFVFHPVTQPLFSALKCLLSNVHTPMDQRDASERTWDSTSCLKIQNRAARAHTSNFPITCHYMTWSSTCWATASNIETGQWCVSLNKWFLVDGQQYFFAPQYELKATGCIFYPMYLKEFFTKDYNTQKRRI